ncbi:ABC transporter permease [Microbacterium kribbense]|uniref:ABC transporter permease n=1 Tax=Microbacterium kribbense TaxID=433645 RepID=A0ABP7GGE1_9MICO
MLRWGTILAALATWQVGAAFAREGSIFLLSPGEIAAGLVPMLQDVSAREALTLTAWEFGIAFVISIVLGTAIAAVLAVTPLSRRSGLVLFQLFVSVPQVAIYALFVLFLGAGAESKIVFGVTHGMLPVVIGILAAVDGYRSNLPQAVRAMGGRRWAVVRYAVIPAVLPSAVTSMRLCASLCLLGILIAELLVSSGGVGRQIGTYSGALQIDKLYALVAVVCIAAIVINILLAIVERRAGRWKA